MSSSRIFSLQGRGLKLDTAADIEPHLANVDPTIIEEIHLGGNTIGVEASEALATFLEKTQVLKVSPRVNFSWLFTDNHRLARMHLGCRFRGHFHRSPHFRNSLVPLLDLQRPQIQNLTCRT
jgi:hypothetical protein